MKLHNNYVDFPLYSFEHLCVLVHAALLSSFQWRIQDFPNRDVNSEGMLVGRVEWECLPNYYSPNFFLKIHEHTENWPKMETYLISNLVVYNNFCASNS